MVVEGEDGDYTNSFYSNQAEGYYSSGFNIMFTEEIKKYGAGSYQFSFRLRAAGSATLNCCWRYDDAQKYTTVQTTTSAGSAWKTVTLTLEVTKQMLENELFGVSVKGAGSPYEYFSVSDIELTKK